MSHAPLDEHAAALVLGSLDAHVHGDFRDYRPESVARAITERMAETGAASAVAYAARLRRDDAEQALLARAMLVRVTALFRDPPVFEALARTVLPELIAKKPGGEPLRAWCIGVATGEEAWSLAMVMDEVCAARGSEILASDADEVALEVARVGRYPLSVLDALGGASARAHFSEADGMATVGARLRARVRFAHHHLGGPRLAPIEALVPSFPLVLCRNVLIYFRPTLRLRALERLVSVLEPGGVLALGPVEGIPDELTRVLVPYPGLPSSLRIFRRVGES